MEFTQEIFKRTTIKGAADYQIMYYSLFNDVTRALRLLQNSEDDNAKKVLELLKTAQCVTEDIYINSENTLKEV